MAGCDGWITIKILELLFASFCMIYKRVTDDEANKLFYFLQKFSREWPLLNSVTWEENGAIFTNITYGGYIIIIIGLIIGQCTGELQRCRKMENFFLIFGAILFIAAGSLELAALEYVEERLVDNAAILGVFSLITGFLFIIDLLLAGRRRKREKFKTIQKTTFSKPTQTEETKSMMSKFSDMNGNIHNGEYGGPRIPKNAVKLLPSSPVISDQTLMTAQGPKNEYLEQVKYFMAPPIIDGEELKTHKGKLKSTESFLRSEKGFYPQLQKSFDDSNNQIVVPTGYVLVPADQFQTNAVAKSDSGIGESQTPSDYAKIIPDAKTKSLKKGYVVIPVDENNIVKEKPRKLQSPTVTTTVQTPTELHYRSERNGRPLSPYLRRNAFTANSSDVSDFEETNSREKYKYDMRRGKSPNEYLEMNRKSQEHKFQLDDSSDERKPAYLRDENYRHGSQKGLHRSRKWHHRSGEDNEGYDEDYNTGRSRKINGHYHPSSRGSSPEKPKSILRFDYGRSSKRGDGLYFPKDIQYDSLDSKKIAEDLRNLKEITRSDIDLKGDLEEENRGMKERLRQEKEAKEKLKHNLADMKKLEKQMRDSEEEKNRRVSEREEQYFGIKDLKQSHREKNFDPGYKIKGAENNFRRDVKQTGKGATEMNERLKEKHMDENKASKEVQEYRDLIDERFHFLDEEEKRKKLQESHDVDNFRKTISTDVKPDSYYSSHHLSGKTSKLQMSDSDEPNNTPSTEDEEIRLRVETPGSTSFKSEALFWLGNDQDNQTKPSPPISPTSPGYVLYTAQNWPESPSPQDRFQFSAKEAQQLAVGTPPKTPLLERLKPENFSFDNKKNSQKSSLLEHEETPHSSGRTGGLQRGLLVRKVDFPMEPKKPVAIAGSTSTWKKWLQPRPKLQHTKSTPT